MLPLYIKVMQRHNSILQEKEEVHITLVDCAAWLGFGCDLHSWVKFLSTHVWHYVWKLKGYQVGYFPSHLLLL